MKADLSRAVGRIAYYLPIQERSTLIAMAENDEVEELADLPSFALEVFRDHEREIMDGLDLTLP